MKSATKRSSTGQEKTDSCVYSLLEGGCEDCEVSQGHGSRIRDDHTVCQGG